jgi:hypothetical protein
VGEENEGLQAQQVSERERERVLSFFLYAARRARRAATHRPFYILFSILLSLSRKRDFPSSFFLSVSLHSFFFIHFSLFYRSSDHPSPGITTSQCAATKPTMAHAPANKGTRKALGARRPSARRRRAPGPHAVQARPRPHSPPTARSALCASAGHVGPARPHHAAAAARASMDDADAREVMASEAVSAQ